MGLIPRYLKMSRLMSRGSVIEGVNLAWKKGKVAGPASSGLPHVS